MFEDIDISSIPGLFDTIREVFFKVGDLLDSLLQPILGVWTPIALFAVAFGASYYFKDTIRNMALIVGGLAIFLLIYRPA